VDLSIAEGEFVTLLGPSGCGKSTLLKMVAGMLEPTDGRLLVWRKPVSQLDDSRREDGLRVPVATLMPWASVQTNVRLPLDLAGVPRKEADARVSRVAGAGGPREVRQGAAAQPVGRHADARVDCAQPGHAARTCC
jgi:ABC-type sugar transport system ATPase subunit